MMLSIVLIGAAAVVDVSAKGLGRRETSAETYAAMNPKTDFCVHAFHQSAVMNDVLYINGGFVVYNHNNIRYEEPNTYLRTLDLSSRFTLNSPSSAPFTFLPNAPDVPELSSGALWPHNTTLYQAGGITEPVDYNFPNFTRASSNAVWSYTPSTSTWTDFLSPVRDTNGLELPSVAGALSTYVSSTSTGYLLGGNQNPWFGIGYPGMLVFNAAASTWENKTTLFSQRDSGAVVHVPIGEKGILVSLGGRRNNKPFPLTQVEIHNLDADAWSTPFQPTSGVDGVPVARGAFCAVLVSAGDGLSHQIYVYGGTQDDGSEATGQLGDVWVLSLPSFEWFRVYDGNATGVAPGVREAHSCHVVAGRMMLVYGGRSKPQEGQACDKTGAWAFDMVEGNWVEEFVPDAGEYEVPEVVKSHLANSTSRFPSSGLADPKIQALFETTITTSSSSSSSSSSTASSSSTTTTENTHDNNDNNHQRKRAGYIVGGIIAGLGVSGLFAFMLVRTKRKVAVGAGDEKGKRSSPSPVPSQVAEVPDKQLPMFNIPEMPDNKMPAWELSASPSSARGHLWK